MGLSELGRSSCPDVAGGTACKRLWNEAGLRSGHLAERSLNTRNQGLADDQKSETNKVGDTITISRCLLPGHSPTAPTHTSSTSSLDWGDGSVAKNIS